MVSIVITAYNVGKWIESAINSAREQTHRDIEIIIVEDCSTDDTREKISKIDHPRIKILYNNCNIGAGASRKRGIEAASGEYILLLDGDDWLEKDFIEALHTKAVENDADIVSGGITIVHSDGRKEKNSAGNLIAEGEEKIAKSWGNNIVFMCNKLIRRSLHQKVPYCTRRFIEDTPVIIPMLHCANKIVYTSNCGYNYRMNSESLTHKATPFKYALFRALCAEDIISFFEKNDKESLKRLQLAPAYSQCINEIKKCHPTAKMIEPYKDEWIEFTTRLIERLGNE